MWSEFSFLLEQQHRHHTQFLRGRQGRATHAYWGVPVAACATRLDESRGEQQSKKRRAAPLDPPYPVALSPSDSSREPLWTYGGLPLAKPQTGTQPRVLGDGARADIDADEQDDGGAAHEGRQKPCS
ncbi:hypothetical protein Landi51_07836 [Colletotrichum acutatum]